MSDIEPRTMQESYRVAIPSYQRADILGERTLPMLCDDFKVDPSRIDIFVADEGEKERYQEHLGAMNYVVGVPGMMPIRRFIHGYYPGGEPLVCVDDDVDGLFRKVDDKNFRPMQGQDEWQEMLGLGFSECMEHGTRLWGIYPVLNAMFMKHRIRRDLRYIVGAFWGCINTHNESLWGTQEYKEDFERSLRFYDHYGAVIRLEEFSLKTAYYKTPGGMQVNRTPEYEEAGAYSLQRQFPHLCSINKTKKSGFVELRLKDSRRKGREVLV